MRRERRQRCCAVATYLRRRCATSAHLPKTISSSFLFEQFASSSLPPFLFIVRSVVLIQLYQLTYWNLKVFPASMPSSFQSVASTLLSPLPSPPTLCLHPPHLFMNQVSTFDSNDHDACTICFVATLLKYIHFPLLFSSLISHLSSLISLLSSLFSQISFFSSCSFPIFSCLVEPSLSTDPLSLWL